MNPLTVIATRLLDRVTVDPITGCWNWRGAQSQSGRRGVWYPELRVGPRIWRVNRLSLVLIHGPATVPRDPDEDALVWLWRANRHWRYYEGAHLCDNSQCVRPGVGHLVWQTHLENVQGQAERRRAAQTGEAAVA